MSRESPIQF